jgi:tetratricopeptide (TPR) repeat protein
MARQAADAALDTFTKALAALQKQDWKAAAAQLADVVETSDTPELRDRARQYLNAVESRAAGGKPGGAGADTDPLLAAVYEKNRGNLEGALALCRSEGRERKHEGFAYLAASIHATEGRAAEAAEALRTAIELNPTNRIHAFHDPDFAELRHEREFQQLFGLA